jgi:hypothetical protein
MSATVQAGDCRVLLQQEPVGRSVGRSVGISAVQSERQPVFCKSLFNCKSCQQFSLFTFYSTVSFRPAQWPLAWILESYACCLQTAWKDTVWFPQWHLLFHKPALTRWFCNWHAVCFLTSGNQTFSPQARIYSKLLHWHIFIKHLFKYVSSRTCSHLQTAQEKLI